MESVSSEEELLQLRNEGKINEDEYEQLLGIMKRTDRTDTAPANQGKSVPVGISILAVLSLVFSILAAVLTGFIWLFVIFFPFILPLFFMPFFSIPGIICGHLALRKIKRKAVNGRGLAIAGLIMGYVVLVLCAICIILFVIAYNQQKIMENAKLMKQRDKMEVQKQTLRMVEGVELKRFRLDNIEGIPSQSGLEIDRVVSSDGNGSLRIEVTQSTTVRLFETGDMDIENARLVYQAKVKTENVQGKVYLEMWCSFTGKGEFFSKGLLQPLTGTIDWKILETPFLLKEGENPDNIKLNLVIEGGGIVWIDDIRLIKYPLD